MLTGTSLALSYRYALVFSTIDFGSLLNCLSLFLSRRLAAVVATYAAGDSALIAASGRYLAPVTLFFTRLGAPFLLAPHLRTLLRIVDRAFYL